MFVPRSPHRPPARRGAILLVVLTLLALFAVVGLSFALYAESSANSARLNREATADTDLFNSPAYAAPISTGVVNSFLAQLIYGVKDTGQDTTSALRGHDLARLMYGANPNGANIVPYNGVGMFADPTFTGVAGITDRRQVINYSYTAKGNAIVDPEHTGVRADTAVGTL